MEPYLNDEEVIRLYYTTQPHDCFETLYSRYVNKVFKRCLTLTKDTEKAQDFTHDIFIRMFAHLGRFQERSSFSTWLYSISYNYCIDQLRLSNKIALINIDNHSDYQSNNTEEAEDNEYCMQKLTRAINSLTRQEAMILQLKYQDELDIRQIANKLNLNVSAVKMRLKRSRDKVKQIYEQLQHT